MLTTLEQIRKRDGRIVPFDPQRISQAITKATQAVHGVDPQLAESLAQSVVSSVERQCESGLASVEQIQDAIEAALIEAGLARAAKAFILYRARRSRIREGKSELMLAVDDLLCGGEAVETPRSSASKLWAVGAAASQEYYLKRMLPEAESVAHMRGEIHVEGLEAYAKAPESLVFPLERLLERGLRTPWASAQPTCQPSAAARLVTLALQAASGELSGVLSLTQFDRDLSAWLEEASDAEIQEAVAGLLQALSLATWRSDSPPSITLVFGDDPTQGARRVAQALLSVAGTCEPLVEPTLVMRVREGVNLHPGDPNYDLFEQAVELASRRMTPLFAFGESPVLGSGKRLVPDRCGAPYAGRGVAASVLLNLPRIALQARRDHQSFESQLIQVLDLAGRHLAQRSYVLGQLKAQELPILMAQGLFAGSEGLAPHDPIGIALRHGQLNLGFVGLAEALTCLEGAHHGQRTEVQERGLALVGLMRETLAAMAERHDLNLVLSGHPVDEAAVRFVQLDRRDFGSLPGITDRSAYTSSFQVPADVSLPAGERISLEAPYHALCPGGHAMFLEIEERDPVRLEALVRRMHAQGVGIGGFSFPLDVCLSCGREGALGGACACGSRWVRRIRRSAAARGLWERLGEDRQAEVLRRQPSCLDG